MNGDFARRVDAVKARAHGQWTSILKALGVDERILNGKNQPCPLPGCGGTDRFAYTDKFGQGNYHCRVCGPGGSLKLAQGVLGLTFRELLERVEQQLGTQTVQLLPAGGVSHERMQKLCRRIWQEARLIRTGDEVDRYLRNRGLQQPAYPRALRCHEGLGYYEKQPGEQRSRKVAEYPAMLACVRGPDSRGVTLHRTYLKDGRKALGDQSKKLLSSGINGAAVRLDEATHELAVAEGIETGLAVRLCTGKPVWAALSAGNLERLWIPDAVEQVWIYADNDADAEYAGQVSAFALAQRLVRESRQRGLRRTVRVLVPGKAGTDWADVWLARLADEQAA